MINLQINENSALNKFATVRAPNLGTLILERGPWNGIDNNITYKAVKVINKNSYRIFIYIAW